jgi:addiction module HigA family antidote
MTIYTVKQNPDRCPTHPGAILREDVIPAVHKSKSEIASLLGISRQHLHDILAEKKPLSPEVAVRIGKLFGGGLRLDADAEDRRSLLHVSFSKTNITSNRGGV